MSRVRDRERRLLPPSGWTNRVRRDGRAQDGVWAAGIGAPDTDLPHVPAHRAAGISRIAIFAASSAHSCSASESHVIPLPVP